MLGMGEPEVPGINLRRATADDAQAIGAVFDASVRAGWSYLGEIARRPMFSPDDWDRLVADHAPPNVLLVATDEADRVVGLAVYAGAGYRPDGSSRESDFHGTPVRELRLVKRL
jgi:hypothetical protein